MPKGPQGQKRPADVIGSAIMVARLATGEIDRRFEGAFGSGAAAQLRAAKARAESMTKEERSAAAKQAAAARWG